MSDVGAAAQHDIFTDNHRWGDLDDWNRAALALHEQGGVHRIDSPGYQPFWAVIDHAALLDIERQPALFTNSPEPIMVADEMVAGRQQRIKMLIHMDPPEHGEYRKLTNDWFKPASIKRLHGRLDELSEKAVDKLVAAGGEIDFATQVAHPYPLEAILEILGLPAEDYEPMLMLTQQIFGAEDPDLQREPRTPEVQAKVMADLFNYFADLTAARRANPTDDLATLIANGLIGGEPMPDLETMSYYILVATAGHDTTASTIAGGLDALLRHPDQWEKLAADPDGLMVNAVEEMLRWTSPTRHFMRTAAADTDVLGQEIKKGDWLYLSYKAANIDPKVFDDPLTFDIERPNASKQVSFGYGIHFCLGAQLARMEIRSLFARLVRAVDSIELAGTATTSKTTFVGGHKTLPIRYTLA